MTEFAANMLLRRLEASPRWPLAFERRALTRILRWAAFRESDHAALIEIADWTSSGRRYRIDPLAPRISEAYADLLFQEDPGITPANESDAGNLQRIVENSDLPSELHWAEQLCSSEGEVWVRTMSSPGIAPSPMITFHSREDVIPLYVGPALLAAAFVTEYAVRDTTPDAGDRAIYRHLEIQSQGRVENVLYLGTNETLGQRVDLDRHDQTRELFEVWDTPIPDGILAERILNKRGRDRRQGRSDYQNIEDVLLALNEAMTIGIENARLTAKKRAVVPQEAVRTRALLAGSELEDAGDGTLKPVGRAVWDAGEDLLTVGALDTELGKSGDGPFKVLEYSFDAAELVAWQNKLAKVAASRAGLTAQILGEGDGFEGEAATGTALRVRLLPAIGSGRGRGRPWDRAVPRQLLFAQLLDASPPGSGGFGTNYSAAGEAPAFERSDPIPRDEAEDVNRHAAAVQGEIESRETAVRDLHPDWSDEEVEAELDRIRSDSQDRARSMGFGGLPAPGEQEDEPPAPAPPGPAQ